MSKQSEERQGDFLTKFLVFQELLRRLKAEIYPDGHTPDRNELDALPEAVRQALLAKIMALSDIMQPRTAEPSQEARAIAALVDHTDWTDTQIAAAVGCHPKSLYRWELFKAARAIMRQGKAELPRGAKPKKGEIEAYSGDLDEDYK